MGFHGLWPYQVVVFCIWGLLSGTVSQAMEYVDTLPKGVRSIQLRYGDFQGLNGRFTESGDLRSLDDLYSIELNSASLVQLEP